MNSADLIISTPHMTLPGTAPWNFHRVIIDESHLLEDSRRGSEGASWKSKVSHVRSNLHSPFLWLCTGTPIPLSGSMHTQLSLLGHDKPGWAGYGQQQETRGGLNIGGNKTKTEVDKLKRIMIRHTKSQRIGGEVALALPDCDCRTVLLDMSADERILHRDAACKDGNPLWLRPAADNDYYINIHGTGNTRYGEFTAGFEQRAKFCRGLLPDRPPEHREEARAAFDRLMLTVNTGQDDDGNELIDYKQDLSKMTKMVTLLGELRALKDEDKDSRAIIFTQHDQMQQKVVSALGSSGWQVFEFNKQTAPTRRHRIIKEFQDGLRKDGTPKVCVATYHTAAVGVTLTAASRVFLMEPCADPATELQAAGRIHRLGQTKEVLIKRFAFRNTIEHAIVDLHEEIKAKRLKAGGAYVSDPIVQQVFKKLNLHHEVHTPDPQHTHEVIWEEEVITAYGQRQPDGSYQNVYGPSNWWKIRRSKCTFSKKAFDISAEKLDKKPLVTGTGPLRGVAFWELPIWERRGEPKPSEVKKD